MADHTATLAVNLEDGTSAPALKAKNALQQLRGQIAADTKALGQMQRAMKNLQGGNSVNVEQYKKLEAAIKAKKVAIAQAQSSVLALGGGFNDVKPKGDKLKQMLEQLTKQAQGMPGPMGGLVGRFQTLGGLLAGGAIALGILAIAAALVALTAASIAAVAALTSYGIAQADARRSELLRLEGLTKMRFFYRAAAGNAGDLQKSIDQVSDKTALGRGELTKYTEQLYRMGLRGQNLTDALEGVAIKATTQGTAAANAFAGMAAGAALSGRSVKAMADTVRARLGGIAARQLLSLNVQTQKLKESFDALFRDINLEGFLTALRTITALFSQNTVTGRALKSLIQGIVQPLIDGISAAAPYAKRFFQGMLLGFLSIGITVLKLRKWFRETFGDSGVFSGLISLNTALKLGQLFVYGLAAAFVGLAMAIAMVTAPIWTALVGLTALYKIGKAAINYLISIDWGAVGDAIVMGLVDGLKLAGKLLLGPALSGLAESAWNAFRSALGIASPSKEFAKLGLAIPQGVAAGVEQGTPTAQGAVQSMVDTPGAGGAGAGGRGPALTIGELHFHAANGSQSKDMANELRAELERVLTGLAVSLGAPVAGGA